MIPIGNNGTDSRFEPLSAQLLVLRRLVTSFVAWKSVCVSVCECANVCVLVEFSTVFVYTPT